MFVFLHEYASLFGGAAFVLMWVGVGFRLGMDSEDPENEKWFFRIGTLVFFALWILSK